MRQPKSYNHSFSSPLRYPGGKSSLSEFIKIIATRNGLLDGHYVEAFAGGASIAWSLLFGEYVRQVHINDIDIAIYSFWKSVLDRTDDLCRMIQDTNITMTEWHKQKAVQLNFAKSSLLRLGFSTFFLNRTNRSGILKAGVIGGKEQNGKWKLDARFNKRDLIKRIQRIARYRSRISVYRLDGKEFILKILPELPKQTLIYFDPPYYAKGKELYQNHYSHQDHECIAQNIQKIKRQPWIVSYDAVPEISTMYEKRRVLKYCLSYSAQSRYSGSEFMFFSDKLKIPDLSHPIISRVQRRLH